MPTHQNIAHQLTRTTHDDRRTNSVQQFGSLVFDMLAHAKEVANEREDGVFGEKSVLKLDVAFSWWIEQWILEVKNCVTSVPGQKVQQGNLSGHQLKLIQPKFADRAALLAEDIASVVDPKIQHRDIPFSLYPSELAKLPYQQMMDDLSHNDPRANHELDLQITCARLMSWPIPQAEPLPSQTDRPRC